MLAKINSSLHDKGTSKERHVQLYPNNWEKNILHSQIDNF